MGTYSKSNFGNISGKVGNAVGSKWRGIKYLRSLPEKSSKAATPLQLAVHAKLALAAAQLSPIKDILYIGFGDKKLNGITGYNVAVKAFLGNAITGAYPNYLVDYPKMQLSKGSLATLPAVTLAYNGALVIGWDVKLNKYTAFADDEVLVVVFNQTANTYTVDDSTTRNDATVAIDIAPAGGDVIHAWAFCIKRDEKTVSLSQYLGTLTI